MRSGKLNTLVVRKLTQPGRYGDGGNLYLFVKPGGTRIWTFRYTMPGQKPREMSLGNEGDVTLAEAREKARAARRELDAGRDPIETRKEVRREAAGGGMTFEAVAALYIASHEDGWRNAKHRWQWQATLETYAGPELGKLPVTKIGVGHVMRVLEPIWKSKPETAARLRGRIEAVLEYAASREWRSGENPARWKGHLANLLPKRSKLAAVVHHPALPWERAPAFMRVLERQGGAAALALRFLILTAGRTSEVTGATWGEVDLNAEVWTVPGRRMKIGRDHRVPLSGPALLILQDLHLPGVGSDIPVFPGGKKGSGLSNMAMTALLRRMNVPTDGEPPPWVDGATKEPITVHGFRSTFRDWAGEATSHPREIAEAALAHTLRDKVEAAYRRGDMLERRAALMADWAVYLAGAAAEKVVPIRRVQAKA